MYKLSNSGGNFLRLKKILAYVRGNRVKQCIILGLLCISGSFGFLSSDEKIPKEMVTVQCVFSAIFKHKFPVSVPSSHELFLKLNAYSGGVMESLEMTNGGGN